MKEVLKRTGEAIERIEEGLERMKRNDTDVAVEWLWTQPPVQQVCDGADDERTQRDD